MEVGRYVESWKLWVESQELENGRYVGSWELEIKRWTLEVEVKVES